MAVYQSRIGVARDKIKILVHHGTEPDFIINYDIKYRVCDELNGESEMLPSALRRKADMV